MARPSKPPATPRELRDFLAPYPPDVRRAMLEGRKKLHALVGPGVDLLYDATSAVCAGVCYTDRPRDCFVNLAAFADHVTLVFGWGKGLPDPRGLLRGSGSQVRHLRLGSAADLDRPEVIALVEAAAARAARPDHGGPATGKVVKVYRGPKRRPQAAGPRPSRRRTATS